MAVAAAAALLQVGCGGSGGDSSTSTSRVPEELSQRTQKLRQATERVKREREQKSSSEPRQGSDAAGAQEPPQEQTKLPVVPPNHHHDSGGGTAQFRTPTGDNSVQESGNEASVAEREDAAAVLHAYLDARVSHKWETACFYMSAGLVVGLEDLLNRLGKGQDIHGCPKILAVLSTGSSDAALVERAVADVGALRVNGDHGFLLYHGLHGVSYAMAMVREGDAWKVAALEPAPLG